MKHTTLVQAHRIHALSKTMTQREIADEIGVSQKTVSNILNGKGLLQQRQQADRMESFLGGVILGNGNVRFHAASPGADNEDGHTPTKAYHPFDVPYEGDSIVPVEGDVLALVLAEEDLLERIEAAGLDPEDLLVIDPDTDHDTTAQLGGERVLRNRAETWDEFVAQCEEDELSQGGILKRLENEGQDVDAWQVRDPAFDGWGQWPIWLIDEYIAGFYR